VGILFSSREIILLFVGVVLLTIFGWWKTAGFMSLGGIPFIYLYIIPLALVAIMSVHTYPDTGTAILCISAHLL
jgi:hypothetical protein